MKSPNHLQHLVTGSAALIVFVVVLHVLETLMQTSQAVGV